MVKGLSVQAPPSCLYSLGSGQGTTKRFGGSSIVAQVTAGCRISIFFSLILLLFNFVAQPPIKKS